MSLLESTKNNYCYLQVARFQCKKNVYTASDIIRELIYSQNYN